MLILGVDPGISSLGYGLLEEKEEKFKVLDFGVIKTKKEEAYTSRLLTIFNKLNLILDNYSIDEIAIESIFFFKNRKTALKISEVKGVILLLAAMKDIEIFEYTPLQVKQAVSSYGRTSKKDLQAILSNILSFDLTTKDDDAADALGVALCHFFSKPLRKSLSAEDIK